MSCNKMTSNEKMYRRGRLYFVSALALALAGINASLRANTAADLQRIFLAPIDPVHSGKMIANILGVPFLGFALTIAFRQSFSRFDWDAITLAAVWRHVYAWHAAAPICS